ncbi:hypothetical protein YTCETSXE_CDS0009 [Staphylococcus phage MVC_VPHSA2]|uniref:DUF1320 domain-containing protein n=1 Tax=Staphylococcus phage MVC_VPHSA1 TaxID=3088876 RepID=A0ABZ0QZD3_9CAUD|nr:hypothetical protein FBHYGVHD_CDS0022 [Staphylococcus phage MVC_VPHSA1]WPF64965.1 hypothetical protein YTCETSXE_CDS0009 [Staphylococcus phage MVC_VPHSA2]
MAYTTATLMRQIMTNLGTSITDADLEVFAQKASTYLDAKLSDLFVVPFSPAPQLVTDLTTDIAVCMFHEARYTAQKPNLDERVNDRWNRIQETISQIRAGNLNIGVPPKHNAETGYATTNDRDPVFDLDTEW